MIYICKICGKKFYGVPSLSKKGRGEYCSIHCKGIGISKNKSGSNSLCWKRVKKLCLTCGKEIYIKPSLLKRGRGKFCSMECYRIWCLKNRKGEKNGHYQGGKITRFCQVCGKKFEVSPSKIKLGGGKFCSCQCFGIWNMKHMKKQSTSIEIKVKKYLKKLKLDYQSQKVIKEGKTIADFYIPAQRIVIYCDGEYWHSLPNRQKIDATQDLLLGLNRYKVVRLQGKIIKSGKFKKVLSKILRKEENA